MKSRAIIDDPRDQSSVHNQSDDRRGPGVKRRKKIQNVAIVGGDPSKAEKQKDKSGGEALLGDDNEFAAASEENDALKKEFEGVPRQHRDTYEKQTLLQILEHCKRDTKGNKESKKESREKMEKQKYVADLIFKIAKSIFEMMKHITYQPQLHPELIASGLVWQAIRHTYFDLKVYFDLKKGLDGAK